VILANIDEALASGARLVKACEVIGLDAATVSRWRKTPDTGDQRRGPLTRPSNALSEEETALLSALLTSPLLANYAFSTLVPLLASAGRYICSERTMYRFARAKRLAGRRTRAKAARRHKPRELIARRPCQVWSWDITYLRSCVRGRFYYLYVVMDVWSRLIVGAEVYEVESPEHAETLLTAACLRHGVVRDELVLHSDNGGPMKAFTLQAKLEHLGVATSYSRPRVSDDNPFSEALMRTIKYSPRYPEKPFERVEDARMWVQRFVAWYNEEHLHSALKYVTPGQRHRGEDGEHQATRQAVYEMAKAARPERWSGATRDWSPPKVVVLNPSKETQLEVAARRLQGATKQKAIEVALANKASQRTKIHAKAATRRRPSESRTNGREVPTLLSDTTLLHSCSHHGRAGRRSARRREANSDGTAIADALAEIANAGHLWLVALR
jgi:transposase InsO family protein